MNELMPMMLFEHEDFGQIEMFYENGKLWTESTATATKLGYSNPWKAINDHCRLEGLTIREVLTPGGIQKKKFIDEGNLYRLIIKSKLPAAQKFESWVFDGILPTLRKTGSYSIDGTMMPVELVQELSRKVDKLAELLTEQRTQLPAPAPQVQEDAEFIRQICKINPQFQIEAQIYSNAPSWAKLKADKYLTILNAAVGLKGDRLKEFIRTWNQENPELKTSYQSILRARKAYEQQGVGGLLAQYGKNLGKTLTKRRKKRK